MHRFRPASWECEDCGRSACLDCSVPVRGHILCAACAAKATGVAAPAEMPRPRARKGVEPVFGVLFGAGVLASAFPWDRFGILTSGFSAWRPTTDPWAFLSSLALAAGLVIALLPATGVLAARSQLMLVGVAVVAAGSAGVSLLRSPEYVSHTPVPFVILVVGAAVAGRWIYRRRGDDS